MQLRLLPAALGLVGIVALAGLEHANAQRAPAAASPNELATSVQDGFTIATVGDLILGSPQSTESDPAFQAVLKLIRDADAATGNYEGNIIDGRHFRGTGAGGFGAPPEVAKDLKAMGWDLVARSNNHAGEYGYDGFLETNRHLDEAGVIYAGAGESYAAARAARFFSTAKGRVGLVSTASSFAAAIMAEPARGEYPGRGGQSALRFNRIFVMPEDSWQAVKTIYDRFPNGTGWYGPTNNTENEITILGERFRKAPAGVTKPSYTYTLNQTDLRDVTAAVTEGKHRSDFISVAIHAHQFADAAGGERGPNTPETRDLDTNPSVADFLPVFAKATIDAGADVVQGTGVHVLRGIEIYKGRPIFYGLGEFFRQMDIVGLSGLGGVGRGEENSPPIKYESIVAVSRFDKGQLAELRLYPVQLTDDGVRMAHRGVPRLASPATAQRILARLQKLSQPFGTTIAIEGNIGVIRTAPRTSSGN
jgi:poly-gamma-glutamate synthesis protein (capsule biosynthesis protein)